MTKRHMPGRFWRELLLGPAYWRHRRLIARSKRWDSATQGAYMERIAGKRLRYYGGDVVRSKAHYMEHQKTYNRCCVMGLVKLMRTGGTSGSPFAFYMDTCFRRQKERAYLFDIWASVGYRPFDLRVVFRGNTKERLISYDWPENCYIISPNRLADANKEEVREFLKRLPPFFLHVYPSSLFTLVDFVGVETFARLPVRGILAGSEIFPLGQMEAFERKFGFRIAHWYGHAEYAVLARHCRSCGGFHFYPTYGYAELIPTSSGQNRIVATSFNMIGTQFVRYDTGDLAGQNTMECDQPFQRVDSIEGREQEFFVDRDGRRRAFGPHLFGIHDEFWDRISAVQFVQTESGWLNVKIVLRRDAHRSWLEDYLRKRFGICELRFEYLSEIPRTAAGKHRYYVSLLDVNARPMPTALSVDERPMKTMNNN